MEEARQRPSQSLSHKGGEDVAKAGKSLSRADVIEVCLWTLDLSCRPYLSVDGD